MPDTKRNQIKKKVSAAKSRNITRAEPRSAGRAGENASGAKGGFASFARDRPIMSFL